MSEEMWRERAQNAEATNETHRVTSENLKKKLRNLMATFGAREKSDGTIDIDYEILVDLLGIEAALELRAVIDEKYKIRGAPGEKPKVRMSA